MTEEFKVDEVVIAKKNTKKLKKDKSYRVLVVDGKDIVVKNGLGDQIPAKVSNFKKAEPKPYGRD